VTFPRLPFESVFSDESGGNIKTPQGEYLSMGAFPVVDQGKVLVGGYVNDASRLCGGGRPAIVFGDHTRCIKHVDFPFCMGADGVKVLRPKIEADLRYLYYYLQTIKLPEAGYDRHFKYLKRIEVVVPPLLEQRRIAAILDQADTLRAKRREALAELDQLTQSIFIEMFGDPARNTKYLSLIPLGDIGKWQSGGTPARTNDAYFSGSVPWFSSGELEGMYVFESIEKITKKALSETSAKPVPRGALMLGMYDTAALKASIAGVDCSCNQAIAFASLDQSTVESTYVYYAICIGREHFRRLQRGVRQKNLNLEMIRQINIPLPPIELQKRFATHVKQLATESNLHLRALSEFNSLFSSLQHRAFRGEL
jgi:type I restriction enzyme S subunit